MGYVLPYGNMSYWGAQVIINLFGTIPGIGPDLVEWIRGDYGIGDATLTRFFSLHVIALPFIIALLIAAAPGRAAPGRARTTRTASRSRKSSGPDGKPIDGIPFHPYYTLKDIVGVGLFLTLFAIVVFFVPTFGGLFMEAPNFEPANPIVDARAHRAGVVLHALLRDPARGSGPEARRAAHGAVGGGLPVPAVARPREEQVDPLSRPARRRSCSARSSSRSWCSCGSGSSPPTASTCCWRASSRRCTSRSSSCCRSSPRPTATARFPIE